MSSDRLHILQLNDFEFALISQKISADLLVYISHAATDGLFPSERQKMEKLRKLEAKLRKAERRKPRETEHANATA